MFLWGTMERGKTLRNLISCTPVLLSSPQQSIAYRRHSAANYSTPAFALPGKLEMGNGAALSYTSLAYQRGTLMMGTMAKEHLVPKASTFHKQPSCPSQQVQCVASLLRILRYSFCPGGLYAKAPSRNLYLITPRGEAM